MKLDTLIHGDSIAILKTFPDNSVHAIISDIPYGIGCDDWDVLHSNTNSAYGGTSHAQFSGYELFRRSGKPLNGWNDADKRIPAEYQAWCSLWAAPHRAQRLSAIYDRRNDKENAEKWEGWMIANLRPPFEPVLWFQKPLKLMELLISLVTLERQTILDPFMGSGTTCVAAKRLNRT